MIPAILLSHLKTSKLCCRHLVDGAVLLYVIGTRKVVEMFAELCVLAVVKGLTGRWTYSIAQWHTFGCWLDGVYRLVRRRRRTQNFTVVWFHPTKQVRLPWPRADNHQHEEEKAKRSLETHVVSGELACCIQTITTTTTTTLRTSSSAMADRPCDCLRPKSPVCSCQHCQSFCRGVARNYVYEGRTGRRRREGRDAEGAEWGGVSGEVSPPQPSRGLGERRELPQWGLG